MATSENSTADTHPNQTEKTSSLLEDDATPVLNETPAPLDFSALTPTQFGISVHSFTLPSSDRKDASRLAQIKARRRSSIGVRGSPGTNSLIRFMAQQRMKTPPAHQTSESQHVRSSPFLPRVTSTLRQKIASFQSLMDVEESEVCDAKPRQDSNSGRCIKTRDYLSDGNSQDKGKENNPPMMSAVPSKRRCLSPREGCKAVPEPVVKILTQGPLPSIETVEEAEAVLISPPSHVESELQGCSSTQNQQQDNVFEPQSPSRPVPDHPAASLPTQPASPFTISSLPSLLAMEPKAENGSTGSPPVKKKVRFGGPLSPELFDKTLPPSTPLQRGSTPARAPTPGGVLRSLLKTPQGAESQTPPAQPDLSSPSVFGASPTFVFSCNSRLNSVGKDTEDKDGKIIFPSMEEIDSAVTKEDTWDTQPLNLNTAFHEEWLTHIVTDPEPKPSTTSQVDVLDETEALTDKDEASVKASAPVRSGNRREKQPGTECENTIEAPTRCSSRKRKQPEESEPVKRSTRSAAKSASGKMKMASNAARRWNKDVDRSLYGSREYASKNPTLSPITESLSLISPSPAAQQTPSTVSTDHEACLNSQASGALSVINTLESPLEASLTSPHLVEESTPRKGKRLPGLRVRKRGQKKRKLSVVDCDLLSEEPQVQTGGDAEDECEDQTTTKPDAHEHTVPEQGNVDAEANDQTSADSEKTSECQNSQNVCLPSGEELGYTFSLSAEPAQRKDKWGSRSSVTSSVPQEQGDKVEDYQMSCALEEKGQAEQAASRHESRSCSDSQEDQSVAHFQLAHWQADFNFEDVFKPVATRGQRSVRRSLRNLSNVVHNSNGAGLAWLPRASPDSSKEPRRRTQGRRLSAAPPVQPSYPEET